MIEREMTLKQWIRWSIAKSLVKEAAAQGIRIIDFEEEPEPKPDLKVVRLNGGGNADE